MYDVNGNACGDIYMVSSYWSWLPKNGVVTATIEKLIEKYESLEE